MWRKIYVSAVIMTAVMFAGAQAFALASENNFGGVFSPDGSAVDLYKTLKFDAYKASGTEEQRRTAEEKLASVKPAAFFIEGVRKIDKRLTLLVIGMMNCPDCTAVYPYVEAMEPANPFISVRYLARNDTPGAREFMSSRTGRTNTPSIFIVRNGKILNRAYVETPSRVTALLEATKNEEERDVIWEDFHSGVYDEDIQSDLLELISNIDD